LAGEPVAQRWNAAAKQRILESREKGTRNLVEAMRNRPPKVLVSASGVGYYGSRADEVLTESAAPGKDFLANVCIVWEREAKAAEKLGVRVATLRIGTVLGPNGGALKKLLTPFRLGAGGRIGNGRQWMSWVHVEDLCRLILFVLCDENAGGALNATSPNPITNETFTKVLAEAVHRPALFPVPPSALRLMFGEMSQVLLDSQRVVPQAAVAAGFDFRYPEISAALSNILATG
jgi:uncharacterized protein (TIGR01777 family)